MSRCKFNTTITLIGSYQPETHTPLDKKANKLKTLLGIPHRLVLGFCSTSDQNCSRLSQLYEALDGVY